jgi:hypothetical protein
MDARNAAILQVDIAYYGEEFPERLRNLWDRLKSEPQLVAKEAKDWLGSWHIFFLFIHLEITAMTKLQRNIIIFLWIFVIIMSTIIGYLIPKAGGDIVVFYTSLRIDPLRKMVLTIKVE